MAGSTRQAANGGAAVAILAALADFAWMLIAPLTLMDGDTGWHLRRAGGSWRTARCRPPIPSPAPPPAATGWRTSGCRRSRCSRLAAGGRSGLILLAGSAFAALLAIVGLHLRRWMCPPAVLAALVLLALVLAPSLLARPHVPALAILAGWIVVLLRAREADRAPAPGWAVLMLAWANPHGSFMFGLALAAAFALEALVDAALGWRRAVVTSWGAFGLRSGGAALLAPGGAARRATHAAGVQRVQLRRIADPGGGTPVRRRAVGHVRRRLLDRVFPDRAGRPRPVAGGGPALAVRLDDAAAGQSAGPAWRRAYADATAVIHVRRD